MSTKEIIEKIENAPEPIQKQIIDYINFILSTQNSEKGNSGAKNNVR